MTEAESRNQICHGEEQSEEAISTRKEEIASSFGLAWTGKSSQNDYDPVSKTKFIITYLLTLAGISSLMTTIFAAPFMKSRGSLLGAFFYSLFAPICHQIPARSFSFSGHPLAVCGRCLGIYTGFFAGSIIYPFIKGLSQAGIPQRSLLVAVSIPIVFDTAGNFLNLWSSSNIARLFLGLSWGIVLPYYFIPAIASIPWKKGGRF